MCKIIEKYGILIRKMQDCENDYQIIAKWLSDDAVLEFYEGRDNPFDLEKTKAKFNPYKRKAEGVTSCIIEIDGKPVGYIQLYTIDDKEEYLKNSNIDSCENPWGVDLFIGESFYRDKGCGTKIMEIAVEYLFSQGADGVFTDPRTENKRAIKCYEKAGFSPLEIIPEREFHEGQYRDSLIMVNLKGGI